MVQIRRSVCPRRSKTARPDYWMKAAARLNYGCDEKVPGHLGPRNTLLIPRFYHDSSKQIGSRCSSRLRCTLLSSHQGDAAVGGRLLPRSGGGPRASHGRGCDAGGDLGELLLRELRGQGRQRRELRGLLLLPHEPPAQHAVAL